MVDSECLEFSKATLVTVTHDGHTNLVSRYPFPKARALLISGNLTRDALENQKPEPVNPGSGLIVCLHPRSITVCFNMRRESNRY